MIDELLYCPAKGLLSQVISDQSHAAACHSHQKSQTPPALVAHLFAGLELLRQLDGCI